MSQESQKEQRDKIVKALVQEIGNRGKFLVYVDYPEDIARLESGAENFSLLEHQIIESLRLGDNLEQVSRLFGINQPTLIDGLVEVRKRLRPEKENHQSVIEILDRLGIKNGDSAKK